MSDPQNSPRHRPSAPLDGSSGSDRPAKEGRPAAGNDRLPAKDARPAAGAVSQKESRPARENSSPKVNVSLKVSDSPKANASPKASVSPKGKESVANRLPALVAILVAAILAMLIVAGSLIVIARTSARPADPSGDAPPAPGKDGNDGYTDLSGQASADPAPDNNSAPSPGDNPAPGGDSTSSGASSGGTPPAPSGGAAASGDTPPATSGDASSGSAATGGATDSGGFLPFHPADKRIAVTFDDGPSVYTDIILDKIEGTGARVTFFVVGNRVEQYAAQTKRAVELGCEIGSHTFTHKQNLTDMTDEELQSSLSQTEDAVRAASGAEVNLLRPPAGIYDKSREYGVPLVLWSVDTEDWRKHGAIAKGTMTEEQVAAAVCDEIVNGASPGAILLLHDLYKTSAEGFCRAFDILTAQGYQFVTVSEMLGIEGREREIGSYAFHSTSNVYHFGKKVLLD